MERPEARPAGRRRDDGASAVEYGLILVAIAAAVTLIVFTLGVTVSGLFSDTCDEISAEMSGAPCA
jgi:pilus assembly protein Flp/PilA